MRSLSLLVPAVAIVAAFSSEAHAAETGAIRGVAVDEAGAPIPGATVTLSGSGIAGERVVVTAADGSYRFPVVPPGSHELLITMEGFAPTKAVVTVRLDETSSVPFTLKMAGEASAVIIVEDTLPVIDTTRSAFSTELSKEYLENVPIGRSYQSAVRTLPGVYGRVDTQSGGPSQGNPSVRGEGQYGNNYMMDGVTTRDPATKTFGNNVNFDAIEDIQVYTDGLPAEFGQSTGMLVNVVLKDGGDEHFGSVGLYGTTSASFGDSDGDGRPDYPIVNLETHEEVATAKRQGTSGELSLTAGGPLVQEKLWYFAALDMGRTNTTFEGSDVTQQRDDVEGLAKITWFITPDISVGYLFSGSSSNIPNYETSAQYTEEAQALYVSDDLLNTLTLRWRPAVSTELELKGSVMESHINVEPMSGMENRAEPQIQNLASGQYTGNYDSFDFNTRSRMGVSLKATQLADMLGSHKFKAGVELWQLKDQRELIFTGPSGNHTIYDPATGEMRNFDYQGRRGLSDPENDLPCTDTVNFSDCAGWREYVEIGEPLGHTGNLFTAFIQDDWQPIDPLTLNLGFRVDREALYQNAGELVIGNWMPQPRIGLAWDVTNDNKTLLSANFGRYYDLMGNTFAEWGDTKNAFVFREVRNDEYFNGGDAYPGDFFLAHEQDPNSDPLVYCTESSLDGYVTHLIEDYGYDAEGAAAEKALAETYCEGTLKPYHMDKMAVGIKREILPNFAVGGRFIMSSTTNLAEDIDTNLDTWVIANLPEHKGRDYWAVELTADKKFDNGWLLLASYTYSEAKGHTPGQFELASGGTTGSDGNNVGVYLDDIDDPETRQFFFDYGYGWLLDGLNGLGRTDDDAGYYGYLPYHSFHQVKLNGAYTLPSKTTLGMVYEFDSGHAWQKRGMVDLYGDYFGFPEGRGSRFMPAVHYIDFHVGQAFAWGPDKKREVEATLDIFNLPDFKQAVSYYENDDENFGLTLYRQSPRQVRIGVRGSY